MIDSNKFKSPRISQILTIIFGVVGFLYGKILYFQYNLFVAVFLIGGIWIMMNAYNLLRKKMEKQFSKEYLDYKNNIRIWI